MDESEKILNDGERAKRLKDNEDWKWAKQKLELTIIDYLSFDSVPEYKTATALQNEFNTRKKAAGIVRAWFEEVEGTGIQQQFNKEKKTINNELITRFGEE